MNDHEVARHLAQRAGDLLVGIRSGSDHASPEELAALADVASHDLLVMLLSEQRPNDAVLSEEGADDKGRLGADRVWIIDPLDGSWHFSVGDPDFAVQVALWECNKGITAAAVYVPDQERMMCTDDEVEELAIPSKVRIIVSSTRPPANLDDICHSISAITSKQVTTLQWGSVGAKLERMISGQADVYINPDGFYEWDIAAPLAIARHYGYTVCDCAGNEIELNKPDTRVENAVISHPEFVSAVIESLA